MSFDNNLWLMHGDCLERDDAYFEIAQRRIEQINDEFKLV